MHMELSYRNTYRIKEGGGREEQQRQKLRVRLVDCNGDYIGIRIGITRNTICCNIILITIHLFGDKTLKTME